MLLYTLITDTVWDTGAQPSDIAATVGAFSLTSPVFMKPSAALLQTAIDKAVAFMSTSVRVLDMVYLPLVCCYNEKVIPPRRADCPPGGCLAGESSRC